MSEPNFLQLPTGEFLLTPTYHTPLSLDTTLFPVPIDHIIVFFYCNMLQ